LELTSAGDGKGIRVTLASPSGAGWDLSRSAELQVTLENEGESAVEVRVSARNTGCDGTLDTVWGVTRLTPRSHGRATVRLIRAPRQPGKFGLGKYPGTSELVQAHVGTIDPAGVTSIEVQIAGLGKGGGTMKVLLTDMRPAGVGVPGPVPFFPFVDRYGQYVHRDWEGKIHSDEELAASGADELQELKRLSDPREWDEYGGWATGPQLKATGHFRAEKHGGRWWLVTPKGRLFFSTGPVGVRSTESGILTGREDWYAELPDRKLFALAYLKPTAGVGTFNPETTTAISFLRLNLLRKFGPDWQKRAAEIAHLRLRKYGLNTMGNWSEREYYLGAGTPYTTPVVYRSRMLREGYMKFPDIFDPKYEEVLDAGMREAAVSTADDPMNIGYFVDNELGWGWKGRSLSDEAMQAPPDQPMKIALVNWLRERHGTVDALNKAWESKYATWDAVLADRSKPGEAQGKDMLAFQEIVTRRYFKLSRDVVRKYAPEKPYLGCRMANYCGMNADALDRAAEFCDVVSFNIYKWAPEADAFMKKYDKPVLIGEFGYWPRGVTPFNQVGAPGSFVDREGRYREYMEKVISRPNFVGAHMYLYADQVISGRGDGEAQPTGFVTVTDQPKMDLFHAARGISERLYDDLARAKQ
jgi:hypothetical protein